MVAFLRKYGVQIVADTAHAIRIPMIKRGAVDYAVGADWTPAAGDVKIHKDDGTTANIGTLPTAETSGNGAVWEFVFSAAEMQQKCLKVVIIDASTKAVEDNEFIIETFGHASAMYQADLSAANLPADMQAIFGTALSESGAGLLAGGFKYFFDIAALSRAFNISQFPLPESIAYRLFRIMLRSDAAIATDHASTLTAINADQGSGGGSYTNTTEALEVLRTRLDARTIDSADYATAANQTTIIGHIDTEIAAILAAVDTEIAAIKAKTDNLPSDPADESSIQATLATIQGLVDDLETRLTATRAGYLDKLNISGQVASQGDVQAINESASRRILLSTTPVFDIPAAGSSGFWVYARTYTGDGAPVNADSTPTLTATGTMSGDLSANIAGPDNIDTGVYRWTYSVSSSHTSELVRFDVSATISSATFPLSAFTYVSDMNAVDFTTADRTKLEAVFNKLPSKAFLTGTTNSDGDVQLNEATGVLPANSINAATLDPDVTTELQAGLATAAVVNAIKAKTDSLTFTVAGVLDSNMTHIGNAAITDTSDQVAARFSDFFNQASAAFNISTALSTLTAAGVRTAVGLASANLDTQLAAITLVTDKLDTTFEVDGSNFRFTTASLVNAPSGGGGGTTDWSAGEREQIRHRLGIDGTAAAPSATPSLGTFAQQTTILANIATVNALLDPEIANLVTATNAIKAKTDNLPSDPADQSAVEAAITAATSPLATLANQTTILSNLGTIIGHVDTVEGGISTIIGHVDTVEALLATVIGHVDTVESGISALSALLTPELADVKTVTDKINTMLSVVGSNWQFTVEALANAPAGGGGGGDATLANQTLILTAIADVNALLTPELANILTVITKLDTMLEVEGAGPVYRFTDNALEEAPAGGGSGGPVGPGADEVTFTILAEGSPVADADVWISTDAEGDDVVAGTLQTDSNGKITFLLDEGNTYYLWMQKDGENPIMGQQFVAQAD